MISRPVNARTVRAAAAVASPPPLKKRTISAQGITSPNSSANVTSSGDSSP